MVDYPKYGYSDRQAFLRQVLNRLNTEINHETMRELTQLYDRRSSYSLFFDAAPAVKKAKRLGLKTAVVTTIPDFVFASAIDSIKDYFDTVMTGYTARCEKSNPLMHRRTLEELRVRPGQTVMIGDELLVDIRIPKRLGIHTILLDRMNKIQKRPDEADEKATTLTQAMATIEKWHK
jgi:FMN phosphatase YigB (HAD superfamily)